jgi:hypothetical protein
MSIGRIMYFDVQVFCSEWKRTFSRMLKFPFLSYEFRPVTQSIRPDFAKPKIFYAWILISSRGVEGDYALIRNEGSNST